MFNHSLQGLECYEIWNTPVKENELLKCREKFYESIELLEKLNESEISTFLHISDIDYKSFEIITQYRDKIFEMAVLLKAGSGVDIADLRRDLCILSYSAEKLQSNVEKVKSLNLPTKCWMLRCDDSTLNTIWENREKNKVAMFPFTNSREYLRNRLKMNDSQLISFSKKYPAVLNVKTSKLRGALDYLLSEGFTTDQIYCTPRILCHSIFTIQ
uniref:Uncharacterized protein n=1 Tax=Rhodnius prolixus TaxID=13249 RepID=T1HZK5_RHOPR